MMSRSTLAGCRAQRASGRASGWPPSARRLSSTKLESRFLAKSQTSCPRLVLCAQAARPPACWPTARRSSGRERKASASAADERTSERASERARTNKGELQVLAIGRPAALDRRPAPPIEVSGRSARQCPPRGSSISRHLAFHLGRAQVYEIEQLNCWPPFESNEAANRFVSGGGLRIIRTRGLAGGARKRAGGLAGGRARTRVRLRVRVSGLLNEEVTQAGRVASARPTRPAPSG